jgi:putative heme iron utilization protein
MENYNVTTEEVLNTIPEGRARNAAAETLKNINETITILRRNIAG